MIKINGKEITQKEFLFDGCHKFYLIEESDKKVAVDKGYDLSTDVFPIEQIAKEFWNSCPLRFIQVFSNFERIVSQCEDKVVFEINGKTITENFYKDEITEE